MKTALLMIVLADLSNFSFAQDGKKIKTQKIAAGKIERYFARRENDAKFSGAVLAARNGSLIFKKGFGMANFEFSIPNSPRTRFRIGSVTKPLTAIAVMMLQEKGRLNVEDGICKYLSASSCPDEWRDVKIRHLLTHTSGIPDLFGAMDAVPVEKTAEEIDRVIAGIKNRQLKARPGEVYAYSNFGYCLLGYIIEKASGKLYAELLDDYIFKPLQMNGTLYDDPRPLIKDRAEGYIRRSGQIYNDKLTDPAGYSAGGLLSSVEDLLVLNDALNSGRLLSRESLDRMFTPFKNEYGFGWKITADKNGRVFNHTGETHGFSSHIAYYPKEKIFIVVLSNIENEDARNTASDIAGIIFDQNP
ncbi:MAG: serine hydrolase domain-containing protein [Pyrinomonadaceae bacterium]